MPELPICTPVPFLRGEEPERAVGIEKDVFGIGRPDVVGLIVAGAVIAVALGHGGVEQDGDFVCRG